MTTLKLYKMLLFIILFTSSALAHANEKLILSVDLVRHGDRSSICQLPNSPLNMNEKSGALTQMGIQQERILGQNLRALYIDQTHLLPELYDPETLYVRSTDTERTIASAKSLLSGLYPDAEKTIHREIPVNVIGLREDSLLIAKPSYNPVKLVQRYRMNRTFWRGIQNQYHGQFEIWSKLVGMPLSNPEQLDCLADNLEVRLKHDLPLPKGITKEDATLIISLANSVTLNEFNHYSFPAGDAFINTVNQYVSAAIQHQSKLKTVLFVGHDSTLMSVMHALHLPITRRPDYAARLNFSVYENGDQHVIKISLDGKPLKVSSAQKI